MCSRPRPASHPGADCLCDAGRLETFDPIADMLDTKRHAKAGHAYDPNGWGPATTYECTVIDCREVAVEGHLCVAHGKRVWA